MEFDQLKGFYHVARLESFTEAAQKLYLTQPAISLQVKALEEELGEKLFERTGRPIKLTHAGEILFRHAEEIVGKMHEIRSVMGDLHTLERGRFILGTSDTTSLYFIPDLIKEFRKNHPNIEFKMVNRMSSEIIQRTLDCEVDLGIVSLPVSDPRLEVLPLLKHPLVCIVSRDNSLAGRKLVRPGELAGQAMLALERESTTRKHIDSYLVQQGVHLKTVMELGSFEIIKKFVAIGLGLSIIPHRAASTGSDGIQILKFAKTPPFLELGVVCRKDRFLPHAARAFLELSESHFCKGPLSGRPA